jgi:recyclin-1
MSNFKRAPVTGGRPPRKDPLASLKEASILGLTKPLLPAEILAAVVDYLAVPDLIRFARVSRRMQEMVYDDARWVGRLKRMGVWDDVEARRRVEGSAGDATEGMKSLGIGNIDTVNGKGRPANHTGLVVGGGVMPYTTNGILAARRRSTLKTSERPKREVADGFDEVTLMSPGGISQPVIQVTRPENTTLQNGRPDDSRALTVLEYVQSIRGQARQEYGKVYKCLGPFYNDIVEAESPMHSRVFKAYDSPEQQAQMLAQLRIFAKSDLAPGAESREKRLGEVISVFDTAALLEFRRGYENRDVLGSMRKYAHVLHKLNGGQSSIDLFLNHNRLILQKASLGKPTDCIDYASGHGQVSLERTQSFFSRLATGFEAESAIVHQVFLFPAVTILSLFDKVGQEILSPYLTSLFDEAHTRGIECYLKTVAGTFAQLRQFVRDLPLDQKSAEQEQQRIVAIIASIFEPHLDLYLAEELGYFKQKANFEVDKWSQALSEQAATTETFLMSNINRQADKKDFMSSFKKVVMMPVNILPSFPSRSANKTVAKALVNGDGEQSTESQPPSRSSTPVPRNNPFDQVRSSTPSLPAEAPTTELAAKAALMNTKLETIRSLFSIEVALNLVHSAKSSLERAAQFVSLGDTRGEAAKQQCAAIFVSLLDILGLRHVKTGFDKAVDHLSDYNPREANAASSNTNGEFGVNGESNTPRVAPLATFLELVNVGDLIQQMLDVFYESELIRLRISIRDDFLDPAVKEKKKFEAMLDERVAAGLGKGIDVLMDEIEFICGTTQMPSDFNPSSDNIDIGPTPTAKKVIEVVSSHTGMLTGSTDKTLLDVFSSEVGLRLFTTLCKHLKRQRISTIGALPLLSDLSAYAQYVASFKNNDLSGYFTALREVGQIYLIEGSEATEMAAIIADGERYKGVFTAEEVLEFAERRSDWLNVRGKVERAMYGQGCVVM